MDLRGIRAVFLCCLAFLVLSCGKDRVEDFTGGGTAESCGVSLRLNADGGLDVVALTRGTTVPSEDDFMVRIENTKGEVLRAWRYAEVPSLIKVVPGSYKLVGWYGADTVLPAFDKPYYYGETKVKLGNGDNLDTVVSCSMAAVKVAVEFDESFGYEYQDFSVDVKTVGDSLHFEKDEVRAGYFKPGSLRLRFLLRPVGSSSTYEYYSAVAGAVKAKQFYKMKLKANTEKGALKSVTITTDSSTVEVPVDVELPPFYLPKAAPKVTMQGFVSGDLLETTEGVSKAATVLVASSGGLTELKVRTVSDTLIARGWPSEVDLMKATAEQAAVLKANGLSWSDELNTKDTVKTTVWVRFDDVIKLLTTAPGVTSGSAFELAAVDRFGQKGDDCRLGVNVAPPVFEFAGVPGAGSVFALKTMYDVKYVSEVRQPVVECKAGDGMWRSLTTVLTAAGDDVYECVGKGLTPITDYAFRVRLGQHVLDAGSFQSEAVLQVPNAGMESWYRVDGKTWNFLGKKGPYWFYWYPWDNSVPATQGWNTVNLKTTNADWKYQYNSISGTMQTTDKHGGSYAALIRTVGWGGSNTAVGSANASYVDPGYLYLGTYSTATAAPDFGYLFGSRPSSLEFYYKYTTKDDQFLAEIVVENRGGGVVTELGRGSYRSGSNVESYTRLVVPVVYNKENFHLKATHVYVVFKSGDKTDNGTLIEVPAFANLSDGKFVGSQLYVDDVNLMYE